MVCEVDAGRGRDVQQDTSTQSESVQHHHNDTLFWKNEEQFEGQEEVGVQTSSYKRDEKETDSDITSSDSELEDPLITKDQETSADYNNITLVTLRESDENEADPRSNTVDFDSPVFLRNLIVPEDYYRITQKTSQESDGSVGDTYMKSPNTEASTTMKDKKVPDESHEIRLPTLHESDESKAESILNSSSEECSMLTKNMNVADDYNEIAQPTSQDSDECKIRGDIDSPSTEDSVILEFKKIVIRLSDESDLEIASRHDDYYLLDVSGEPGSRQRDQNKEHDNDSENPEERQRENTLTSPQEQENEPKFVLGSAQTESSKNRNDKHLPGTEDPDIIKLKEDQDGHNETAQMTSHGSHKNKSVTVEDLSTLGEAVAVENKEQDKYDEISSATLCETDGNLAAQCSHKEDSITMKFKNALDGHKRALDEITYLTSYHCDINKSITEKTYDKEESMTMAHENGLKQLANEDISEVTTRPTPPYQQDEEHEGARSTRTMRALHPEELSVKSDSHQDYSICSFSDFSENDLVPGRLELETYTVENEPLAKLEEVNSPTDGIDPTRKDRSEKDFQQLSLQNGIAGLSSLTNQSSDYQSQEQVCNRVDHSNSLENYCGSASSHVPQADSAIVPSENNSSNRSRPGSDRIHGQPSTSGLSNSQQEECENDERSPQSEVAQIDKTLTVDANSHEEKHYPPSELVSDKHVFDEVDKDQDEQLSFVKRVGNWIRFDDSRGAKMWREANAVRSKKETDVKDTTATLAFDDCMRNLLSRASGKDRRRCSVLMGVADKVMKEVEQDDESDLTAEKDYEQGSIAETRQGTPKNNTSDTHDIRSDDWKKKDSPFTAESNNLESPGNVIQDLESVKSLPCSSESEELILETARHQGVQARASVYSAYTQTERNSSTHICPGVENGIPSKEKANEADRSVTLEMSSKNIGCGSFSAFPISRSVQAMSSVRSVGIQTGDEAVTTPPKVSNFSQENISIHALADNCTQTSQLLLHKEPGTQSIWTQTSDISRSQLTSNLNTTVNSDQDSDDSFTHNTKDKIRYYQRSLKRLKNKLMGQNGSLSSESEGEEASHIGRVLNPNPPGDMDSDAVLPAETGTADGFSAQPMKSMHTRSFRYSHPILEDVVSRNEPDAPELEPLKESADNDAPVEIKACKCQDSTATQQNEAVAECYDPEATIYPQDDPNTSNPAPVDELPDERTTRDGKESTMPTHCEEYYEYYDWEMSAFFELHHFDVPISLRRKKKKKTTTQVSPARENHQEKSPVDTRGKGTRGKYCSHDLYENIDTSAENIHMHR